MSAATSKKAKKNKEFGDFQTPDELALKALQTVRELFDEPQSIVEPTCGQGAFLLAAAATFPKTQRLIGLDINKAHLDQLSLRMETASTLVSIELIHADFFATDWHQIIVNLQEPIFIVGNPPWITAAELGALQSGNVPQKTNFQGHRGLDALTGKSNFDISEWMLRQYLNWLHKRKGAIAVLCKRSVAHKILLYVWENDFPVKEARIYRIDSQRYFNVAVDACFFVLELGSSRGSRTCAIYENIADLKSSHEIGYRDGHIVTNASHYDRWRHLHNADSTYTWRSGIKHDCTHIMELERVAHGFRNGYGLEIPLEEDYLYPLFKSSDVKHGALHVPRKYMLVTQKHIGEPTSAIKYVAPQTWKYLQDHADHFAKRRSSIYKKQPPFAIFGVGDYTFTPWKVAISGFYKSLEFGIVGPVNGRPAVFDDTVYFLPCQSEQEAQFLSELLNSYIAQEFYRSMILWSSKRPVTIDILKRLDMAALATELGRQEEYSFCASLRTLPMEQVQPPLFPMQ